MVHERIAASTGPREEGRLEAATSTSHEQRNGVEYQRSESFPPESDGAPSASRPGSRFESRLLQYVLHLLGSPPITIELWDGKRITAGSGRSGHCLRVGDRRTLWKLLLRPEFGFAEAYATGRIQLDGDLTDFVQVLFTTWKNRARHRRLKKLGSWTRLGSRSQRASRENIHHHYDIGNDFYRLWLDEKLLYTCAYFDSEPMSLEEAQIAKMDHVCRKLCLREGEQVIEAGCGWGAFALHMARHYGARVTAYNISREQVSYARSQARQAGLEDRVTFVEDDWRQIEGECDVFVSVGMLEHVGPENYRKLGETIHRCLKPNGRGLIHSIGLNEPRPLDSWIERRIFPGAQPPTLRQAMRIFEPYDMSVLDVENLRLHYAMTLCHWLERFERSSDVVREMFDETFVRTWRLYLASSIASFQTGWLQLFQILFAPATNNDMPLTRAHLYRCGSASATGAQTRR